MPEPEVEILHGKISITFITWLIDNDAKSKIGTVKIKVDLDEAEAIMMAHKILMGVNPDNTITIRNIPICPTPDKTIEVDE